MDMNRVNFHRAKLSRILISLYQDETLMTSLGFKGGTAAMFLYGLPRLSTDLDFDLISDSTTHAVMEKLASILPSQGKVKELTDKKNTIFSLVSYDTESWNIKLEISKRKTKSTYESVSFLGTPIRAINKPGLFSGKLAALLSRKEFAGRDVFDLWYFLDNHWPIDETVTRELVGCDVAPAYKKAMVKIASIHPNRLLHGYGEFITESQKEWVKRHLKQEVLSLLAIAQMYPVTG